MLHLSRSLNLYLFMSRSILASAIFFKLIKINILCWLKAVFFLIYFPFLPPHSGVKGKWNLRNFGRFFYVRSGVVTFFVLICLFPKSWGNNIQVSNLRLTGQNTTNDFTYIRFDVSWDNSWRLNAAPANWDAAWLFAKFRLKSGNTWRHCSLNWVDGTGTGDGHNVPTGATISSAQDGTNFSRGVFLYSANQLNAGSTVNYTNLQLRWNYGADGVADGDSVEISVFGIEMVYVPQGAFYLGGAVTGGSFSFYSSPTTGIPYLVNSEYAITVGTANDNLRYDAPNGNWETLLAGTVPAEFPKGFRAFYCMKYELTQSHWISFINHLTTTQIQSRYNTVAAGRNAFSSTNGVYSTSRGTIPVTGVSAADMLSYLDWAALRPMTEMEYEKACRGTLYPVEREKAWGTEFIVNAAYTLSNALAANEGIATNYTVQANTGNVSYSTSTGVIGPLRNGIFAANENNAGRVTSGGTYYGIMEMSGNLQEFVVTINTAGGRAFTGVHGDGALTVAGLYNASNWGAETDYRFRGGSYVTNPANTYTGWLDIAARSAFSPGNSGALEFYTYPTYRWGWNGIRGVRTAP